MRQLIYRCTAFCLLVLLTPLFCILYILVKTDSRGPFIFRQKRAGKNRKPFFIYKIRTMVDGADHLQAKLRKSNEADGPVFKIRNDPRYTNMGKWLSHSALDEIPQLFNIVRGEMSFVGPRPLPLSEAARVPAKYQARFTVLPGMTSEWIVRGAHRLTFDTWMKGDLAYANNPSLRKDIMLMLQTAGILAGLVFRREPAA